jgi:acetyltransferase-like isoleucine patch superfamily enzyme
MSTPPTELDPQIQNVLADRRLSQREKYALLAVGSTSLLDLLRYEVLTGLLSGLPGALGYAGRRRLYRSLFRSVGRNVTIGRHVTVRGGLRISLGNNVFIDDNCVLDARGPDAAIVIEDDVLIARNTTIRTRGRELRIGRGTDIGSNCIVATDNRLRIGRDVLIAAYTYITAGGNHSFADRTRPIKEQGNTSKGGCVIEDGVWIGARSTVLDGVTIGEGAVVGAHSLVNRSLPPMTVAHGCPARVQRER